MKQNWTIGVVLFDKFELLDVFGPLEMFGANLGNFDIHMVAETKGEVTSAQSPKVVAEHVFHDEVQYDIILVPGGIGTRQQINNLNLISWLKTRSEGAEIVMSVCTGGALLAKSGVLDGKHATTNKMVYDWVTSQRAAVNWRKKARWVEDGKFFTSSGVTAGMDMTLAIIAKLLGRETAKQTAIYTEYEWHDKPDWDPFAEIHGLVE